MEFGFIKLYRQLQELKWWTKHRFSWGQAWVDMLMMTNYKDESLVIGIEFYKVPAGSFVTSQRKLAKRWKWSISTVNAFLNFLQKSEQSIEHKTEHSFTHIYIRNWEKYQSKPEHLTERLPEHSPNTHRTLTETNKEVKEFKEPKEVKNKYMENVFLTTEQYDTLLEKQGQTALNRIIEILNNYKTANGKKYKSDYHAILNWVANRYKQENSDTITYELGQVIKAYKLAKHQKIDDTDWDKLNISLIRGEARQLLGYFKNWKLAAECIGDISQELEEKHLDWNFKTIVSRAADWNLKRGER